MRFKDIWRNLMGRGSSNAKGEKVSYVNGYESSFYGMQMETIAVNAAVNLIAGAVSQCEFRTMQKGKEVKENEYFLWNVEPNKNQNSSQFLQEIISRLLLDNECLVVEIQGQLIIAESYCKREYAVQESTFEQVYRCGLTFCRTFKMSEVLYFKLSNESSRRLLRGIFQKCDILMKTAMENYEKNGGEKGVLDIGTMARGDQNFEERYKRLINEDFKTYFKSRNAVLPLFDGFSYTPQQRGQSRSNEINDIKALDDQIQDKVAQAFQIPPALLKGEIADLESSTKTFLSFCIDPLCGMLQEEINRKRYGKELLKGNFISIDTSRIEHINIFSVAESADKLIASRIFNTNEIRRKLGEEKINKSWADEYVLTKNYQTVGKEEPESYANEHAAGGKSQNSQSGDL